eukprot:sb/3475271/
MMGDINLVTNHSWWCKVWSNIIQSDPDLVFVAPIKWTPRFSGQEPFHRVSLNRGPTVYRIYIIMAGDGDGTAIVSRNSTAGVSPSFTRSSKKRGDGDGTAIVSRNSTAVESPSFTRSSKKRDIMFLCV